MKKMDAILKEEMVRSAYAVKKVIDLQNSKEPLKSNIEFSKEYFNGKDLSRFAKEEEQ
jgi:hypothetical protein